MSKDLDYDTRWRTIQIHAAGHVVGAIIFAGLALGMGLALGGFIKPQSDRCIPERPVELFASHITNLSENG